MKKHILLFSLLCLSVIFSFGQQNALLSNGRLQVIGNQLSNQCGDPVQLRGLSTHAPMAHQNCYKSSAVAAMADEWGADVIRLAMYTEDLGESQGYINGDRTFWNNWIDGMVDLAEENDMYIIIDWHILKDNNPFKHIGAARTFFSNMSQRYKNRRHVLYEICNEPNGGVSWGTIKDYANEIIPLIRANDPNGIILVGTPEWCSKPQDAAANPITGANAKNVMYTVHFYANSHYWQNDVAGAASKIPIFVSEWGSVDASGNGGFNQGNSDTWLGLLNNASGQKISWCNWAFVDKDEAAATLKPGACQSNSWDNRTVPGNYIFNKLKSGDNFSVCAAAGDSDGDGVTNGEDQCPGTPANSFVDATGCVNESDDDGDGVVNQLDNCPGTPQGTVVNAVGCEIANDFISNVCMGFNNVQNYIRSDFEFEYANVFGWNSEVGESPVYYSQVKNGELVIDVTKADPNYAAMGISFGEEEEDGRLVQFDMSAKKEIEMDLRFEPTGGYAASNVLFRIQIEDADGNVINSDALENDHRQLVDINTWETVSFDFTDGTNVFYGEGPNGPCDPCVYTEFDFTKVTKIIMFCNPGAGETWSKPEFTGIWRIDNLKVGYDESIVKSCEETRDDDNDGVREENDECRFTLPGNTVDADGCAAYQLDADDDGVSDADDKCPNTPANTTVNSVGCDASTADDDEDGVANTEDECPATPAGETVNAEGCSDSQSDEDNDGVLNKNDQCPGTPFGETVNAQGCSADQLNKDDDEDGVVNANDICPNTPSGETVNTEGCANSQLDDDEDGTPNGQDGCPNDKNKIAPGLCGCGVAEGCVIDCNGDLNGTAYKDNCDECVGGNTGLEACVGNPYNGEAQKIPGKVQVEFFDEGGQGIAYNDITPSQPAGSFRTSEGVFVEGTTGSYNVGYTTTGEWINYTVNIEYTGTYNIDFRVASERTAGAWHLELDGETITGSNKALSTATGGWQTYTLVTTDLVTLSAGNHILTLVIDGPDFNIDYIDFRLKEILVGTSYDIITDEIITYPNPANDYLMIQGNITQNWSLYNALGFEVKSGTENQINMQSLSSGVYFLHVNSQVIKVVKN